MNKSMMFCWGEMSLSTTATATPTAPFNPMSFQTECEFSL